MIEDITQDADRIAGATSTPNKAGGLTFCGPSEWQPCDEHPAEREAWRWTWLIDKIDIATDGTVALADHLEALEDGQPEIVTPCPRCHALSPKD